MDTPSPADMPQRTPTQSPPSSPEVRATLATLIVALASTVRVTDPGALDTVDTISRLTDAYTRYSGQGLAVQRFALERQAAQR